MDELSQVLDAVRMRGQMFCRLEARAPWAMSAAPNPVATFHGVVAGDAVLQVPGERPVRLAAGDVTVLCHGAGHSIGDEDGRAAVPFRDVMAASEDPWLVRCGGHGARTTIVCGAFSAPRDGPPLLQLMPSVLLVRGNARVQTLLELLAQEGGEASEGRDASVARLTEALFVEIVRTWSQRPDVQGLSALADKRLARALAAIHKEPARDWTVDALARLAGMSRSAFALAFNDRVGSTPLAYVAQWRLYVAKAKLRETRDGVAQIAEHVGYESEASLSKAFKKRFGLAPGAYRKSAVQGDDQLRLG